MQFYVLPHHDHRALLAWMNTSFLKEAHRPHPGYVFVDDLGVDSVGAWWLILHLPHLLVEPGPVDACGDNDVPATFLFLRRVAGVQFVEVIELEPLALGMRF